MCLSLTIRLLTRLGESLYTTPGGAPSFAPLRRVLAPRGSVIVSWEGVLTPQRGVLAPCRRGVALWGIRGFKSDACAFKGSVLALGQDVRDMHFFFHLIATVTIRCMQCRMDWSKDEQSACWKPYKHAIGNLQLHQQSCWNLLET